jgi:ABC-type bacteriocin/lantibiotic exporter with double-glycine peptidase domain
MRGLRRFFATEVVQTSSLDCGPAALKCLLESFGIPVHYGRLREACQTGLDGTSIDTMEVVANQLGLEAEQITIPVDHLLLPEANALPALVVVQLSGGITHFVVVWRRYGSLLQVMDPSVGRRWISCDRFLRDVYRHTMLVQAAAWREFAGSDEFQQVLQRRLRAARIPLNDIDRFRLAAKEHATWSSLARLDAATRLLNSLVATGALKSSKHCVRLLEQLCADSELIPDQYWSVRPTAADEDGTDQVSVTGAILVRVRGKRLARQGEEESALSPELAAAKDQSGLQPGRAIFRYLSEMGATRFGALCLGLLGAGGGVVIEAILFRSLFGITTQLHVKGQRIGAMAAILLFCGLLLLFDVALFSICVRLGRQLEIRLRTAFLAKIPLLGDRYFQSRLTSDMAERSHAMHRIRHLPDVARQFLVAVFKMLAMSAGLVWLQPSAWPIVLGIIAAATGPLFLSQPLLTERDLRIRSHAAGLTRFYLDAMLGLQPIRSHNGARSILQRQEKMLGSWAASTLDLQKTVTILEALQLTVMFGLVVLLLIAHPLQDRDIGRVLLIIYWALNLPMLGQEIASLARQYPGYRNMTLRALEPLGAPEEERPAATAASQPAQACSLEFFNVSAQAAGHTILHDVNLQIGAGEHVAIVGPSGAGKSSLAGLLLSWLTPATGEILIDGSPLDPRVFRTSIAWVDPAVQLWNRSLLDNVYYGSNANSSLAGEVVEAAALRSLLETLPDGLQSRLGEGGALVSGGEGQRVRLARAMLHRDARLVILDEPFRGLDRSKRRELLSRARKLWNGCTLLCITHDIAETESFDRVLVVENGSISEDGTPWELRHQSSSRYVQLLAAEHQARRQLWSNRLWRRIRIENGRAIEAIHDAASVDEAEVA